MTTAIAIYAAIVATAGLGWQVWLWAHRQRTHVTVEVLHSIAEKQTGTSWGQEPPSAYGYELTVVARNRGSEREFVRWIGVESPDGYVADEEVRQELPPRGAVEWTMRVEYHPDADFSDGFVGLVQLESGSRFESEPQGLDPELLELLEP